MSVVSGLINQKFIGDTDASMHTYSIGSFSYSKSHPKAAYLYSGKTRNDIKYYSILTSMILIPIVILILGILAGYNMIDRFDPDSLKGKRVVLTGASSGIGEQMAYHYARLGADLMITARREFKLQEVIDRCKKEGMADGNYHYFVADMANMTSAEALIQGAERELGGVDYLVLNHIIPVDMGMWKGSSMNLTLLQTILDVNFNAYVHLASHALPALERSGGSIIIMSSLAGRIPQPYLIAYSASKFALDGFFGGLREELTMKGSPVSITICIIGLIGTDSTVRQMQKFGLHFLLDKFPVAEPSDAALAIIKGGATKTREVYFPYFEAKLMTIFRDWFPETLAAFNRYMFSRS